MPAAGTDAERSKAATGTPAFPALLLGLCAAGGTPAPAVNAATATPAGELPADAAAVAPEFTLPGLGTAPAPGLPRVGASGKPPGDPLPDGGTDLPPPDIDTLLASLGLPTRAAENALVAGTIPPQATTAPGPETTPQAPAQGAPANLALLQLRDQARAAVDGATNVAAWQDDADGQPAATDLQPITPGLKDNSLPDATTNATAQRGMEPALPAEFRARLDTLLAAAHRPAAALDTSTISLTSLGTGSGATSPGSLAHAGTPTSSPFDSLPALQPLNNQNAWSQSLGDRLLLMADKGLQSATIKLQPEHLGPMQIQIQVDEDGTAQVLFSAHHAQTRDALESAIPRLRDMFADQGLSLMQANVDSGRSAFAQRDFAASLATGRNWGGNDPDAVATPDATAWRVSRGSEHRVDVLV